MRPHPFDFPELSILRPTKHKSFRRTFSQSVGFATNVVPILENFIQI